eukprot:5463915-Amphidinium_carterae.1
MHKRQLDLNIIAGADPLTLCTQLELLSLPGRTAQAVAAHLAKSSWPEGANMQAIQTGSI